MTRFTMLRDRAVPAMQSVYAAGMSYTVQSPETVAAALQARGLPEKQIAAAVERAKLLPSLLEQFLADGSARLGGPETEVQGG